MKRVCFFGLYNPDYSRNKVLIAGFQNNNWQVVECRVDPRFYPGCKKYWQLIKTARKIIKPNDLVLVAYPGQTAVWLARLLFWHQMVVFDAFTSLYDSNVFDRQLYPKNSWRAWRDWLFDWLAIFLANKNLVDTNEHAKYFQQTFGIGAGKFIRVFVGSEIGAQITEIPRKSPDYFLIHFHGHYIPLQGIEYIIKAAKILETEPDIKFRLIGSGQEHQKIKKMAMDLKSNNIDFWPESSMEALAQSMIDADLVLGIFGTTPKTSRVIPNKVFEALALGKAVLTSDTPAVRELLTDGQDVLLCQAGNAEDLATKIIKIKNDPSLKACLEFGAKGLFNWELASRKIVANLIESLSKKI